MSRNQDGMAQFARMLTERGKDDRAAAEAIKRLQAYKTSYEGDRFVDEVIILNAALRGDLVPRAQIRDALAEGFQWSDDTWDDCAIWLAERLGVDLGDPVESATEGHGGLVPRAGLRTVEEIREALVDSLQDSGCVQHGIASRLGIEVDVPRSEHNRLVVANSKLVVENERLRAQCRSVEEIRRALSFHDGWGPEATHRGRLMNRLRIKSLGDGGEGEDVDPSTDA